MSIFDGVESAFALRELVLVEVGLHAVAFASDTVISRSWIDVTEGSKIKITNNTSSGNSDDGIEATGTKNKITGNTSTGNADDGIAVGDRKNKVIGNTSTGNGTTDILAEEPCKNNKFKDNTFGTGSSCVQ